MANEKGADLVAIGIADYISPTVFMSKKNKNILKPADFIGKKVGVQSGGATEFVYRALIKKLDLENKGINEVQIGFDMKPFVENQFDVRPGFIFDEVVYLDQNNIPYNLIEPKDYGIVYPGRVYFVKREFLKSNKDLLKVFIQETQKGWNYALNNPEEAIRQLQAFEPKINFQREFDGLKKAKAYFGGFEGKILNPDIEACNELVKILNQLKVMKTSPNFEEYFDTSLL
jgi:ABC-type nitrate/sulfonate/bicarbonate transport system substrate-binding protein